MNYMNFKKMENTNGLKRLIQKKQSQKKSLKSPKKKEKKKKSDSDSEENDDSDSDNSEENDDKKINSDINSIALLKDQTKIAVGQRTLITIREFETGKLIKKLENQHLL